MQSTVDQRSMESPRALGNEVELAGNREAAALQSGQTRQVKIAALQIEMKRGGSKIVSGGASDCGRPLNQIDFFQLRLRTGKTQIRSQAVECVGPKSRAVNTKAALASRHLPGSIGTHSSIHPAGQGIAVPGQSNHIGQFSLLQPKLSRNGAGGSNVIALQTN